MTMTAVTKANPSSTPSLSTIVRDDIVDSKLSPIEEALDVIEAASTGSLGEVCVNSAGFKSLPAGVALDSRRYDTARQKTDMTAMMLQNLGAAEAMRHNDALTKSLLVSVDDALEARVIALNASTGTVITAVWLKRSPGSVGEPSKVESHALQPGSQPDSNLPWFENAGSSAGLRGWWTIPYFSCKTRRWLISYSVNVKSPDVRPGIREFISIDIDISDLEINQCYESPQSRNDKLDNLSSNQIAFFKGTHKCHIDTTQCVYQGPGSLRVNENGVGAGWAKGAITLLAVSIFCAFGTIVLVAYMYQHRKLKVFKVASPIFLSITLLGCALMYLELAEATFISDTFIRRVSLTYRVKSAHKVKLTDKQLLQWMVPILLVMLIFLGTWTVSSPPYAEVITDSRDLKFYQCSYNWWDHSLAIGEILFLAWGIKVIRVLRGQGDQWDSRARARGVTASFSLNGIGLVPEETTDLYQENEELKEEIQKLAARIEFMKIVHMEVHNRHIKPKMGGYFSTHGHGHGHPSTGQSPIAKSSTASFILKTAVERGATAAAAAAVEDSTFPSGSLHRARRMEMLRERKAEREREREKERNKDKEQKEKPQQERPARESSVEKV
ncbi:putative g-protein coupled receptor [Lasius niger]|uniref:Putative g-protein coupled receptor n=1 Tax=Lasius niger TaxID=67767 RepID=A0A0J7KFX5_LASNI|nr:putative g-protein coupled receptor [Lasius niger]